MQNKYREIYDPLEDIIGRFLSGVGKHPTEDDIIGAIDHKYSKIKWEVLYLKRQGYSPYKIMRILHIGEISYEKAIQELKGYGNWKEYVQMGLNKGEGDGTL